MVPCIIKYIVSVYIYIYVQLDVTYCSYLFKTSIHVSGVLCPSSVDNLLPEDGKGTPETCIDVLNKITTINDIKLDTYIYI
jgi:hypothetical protein